MFAKMHRRRGRMGGRKSVKEYIEKKAQKITAKVAKKLKAPDILGYANDSNPFGDPNLRERFVWRKKIEHDLSRGLPLDAFSLKAEKKRQRERLIEIENVKKRKEYRALEKAQLEEEIAFLARERAQVESQDWKKKEKEFLLDQSKVGSEIRLREGRGKPIDLLTKHLYPSDDLDVEIDVPYMVFKGLTVHELEDLYEDIKLHLDLDKATPTHMQYWQALFTVCDWELSEARERDSSDGAIVCGEQHPPDQLLLKEQGMHSSIEPDVQRLLQGKSYRQLEALRSQVEAQMQSGTAKVVEFWEVLLRRLDIFKAKACLEEIHAEIRSRHHQHLEKPTEFGDSEIDFSPKPDNRGPSHDGKDIQVLLPKCTMREENPERHHQELGAGPAPPDDNFEKKALEAMGAMEEGDANFGWKNEINLDLQVYWWRARYSPRKPKYFNRVHMGYEWNKYNRTHYDHDSPPPKIVQGYKFNIFYPDLVDKEKAPTYAIEKDGNSLETCIIRFHSGPPYEDIAFRVLNKEWDYSHKRGFKCTFGQGILRLYFNFKTNRYRR